MTSSAQVLDVLEGRLASLGFPWLLVSGIPLPGRPLVLRLRWPGIEQPEADDAVLGLSLRLCRANLSHGADDGSSALRRAAIGGGATAMLCVPVHAFRPYQGVVVAAGRDDGLSRLHLNGAEYLCEETFGRLLALGALPEDRPGDLSTRERRVVAMSAEGKTANDIAEALAISQRTVHAHLQNASEKLRARNKTQTVVEAIRYGQITL